MGLESGEEADLDILSIGVYTDFLGEDPLKYLS
jgi:hypothetical protein